FLLNIKVIPYESPAEEGTGKKLKLFDVVFRETVGRYLSGLMLAGYIVAVFHPQKRAIHDILGNTRVVYSFGRKIAASSPTPVIAATPIATPIQPSATDGDGI
ncbi:MAG: hypothetical protein FWH07_02690, partial [Oscillospiraceae bacterium]|nr:hypothetical protein [Oscillospiraceae bacterium]